MTKREQLQNQFSSIKELFTLISTSDYVDCRTMEGHLTVRVLLASIFSINPFWLRWLIGLRRILAVVLRLTNRPAQPVVGRLSPTDVPMQPGEKVALFTVRSAEQGRFWIADIPEDKHIGAQLSVVAQAQTNGLRKMSIITTVQYRHWIGRLYFGLIRPFHHLILISMLQSAKKTRLPDLNQVIYPLRKSLHRPSAPN